MSEYEERVKNGTLPPANGMEWLLMQMLVEDAIKDPDNFSKHDAESLLALKIEIDHLFQEEPETLKKFYKLVEEKIK